MIIRAWKRNGGLNTGRNLGQGGQGCFAWSVRRMRRSRYGIGTHVNHMGLTVNRWTIFMNTISLASEQIFADLAPTKSVHDRTNA